MLKQDGTLVIEVQYLVSMLKKTYLIIFIMSISIIGQ